MMPLMNSDIQTLMTFMAILGATVHRKSKKHFVITNVPKVEMPTALAIIKRHSKDLLIEIEAEC